MTFAVVARYVCAAEDADLVSSRLLTMREHTRQEPGNIDYVVHLEEDTEATFVLYEQYVDKAAFDAHTETPHFVEHIVGVVRPRIIERTAYFSTVL